MRTQENKYQSYPQKKWYRCCYTFELLYLKSAQLFSRSGVPLDLIMQTTKHLKRQMNKVCNQLEMVPLYNITRNTCSTQGKHKSARLDTRVTLMVTKGASPFTSVNRRYIWTRLILV